MTVSDPIGAGLASSLEHPGGNVTGVIQQPLEFNNERLAFLKKAVPSTQKVGLLVSSALPAPTLNALTEAAAPLGVVLHPMEVRSANDLEDVFATAAEQSVDSIMVFGGTLFTANRPAIVRRPRNTACPRCIPVVCF